MYKPLVAQRVDGRLTITTQEAAERSGRRNYTYPLPGRLVRLVFRNLSEELQLYEYTIVNSERKASMYGMPDARFPLYSGFFARLFGNESVALFYRLAPDLLDERAVHLTPEEEAEVKATIPEGDEMNYHDYTLAYGVSDSMDVIGTRSIDDLIGVLERTRVRKIQDFNDAIILLSEVMVTLEEKLELAISSNDEDLIDLSIKNSMSFFEPPKKRKPKRRSPVEKRVSEAEKADDGGEEQGAEDERTIAVNTDEVKEILRRQEEAQEAEPSSAAPPVPVSAAAEAMGDIFDTMSFKAIAPEPDETEDEDDGEALEDKQTRDMMMEQHALMVKQSVEQTEDLVDENEPDTDVDEEYDIEPPRSGFGRRFLRLIGIEMNEEEPIEWSGDEESEPEDGEGAQVPEPKRRRWFSLFEDSIEELEERMDQEGRSSESEYNEELEPEEDGGDVAAEELPDDLQYEPRREGEQIVIGNTGAIRKVDLDLDETAVKKQYPAKKSKKRKNR